MFVEKERLYMFVQPQEIRQFEAVTPNIIQFAYESAIGRIDSEIGYIYDLPTMLSKQGVERDNTLLWLVTVFTCANIVGSSINIAPVLQNEYVLAQQRLQEIKSGFSTILDADRRSDEQDNANIQIVKNNQKYIG